MNCNQAQALLAAYHDLKQEQIDTTELDVHLEQCSTCRQVLARSSFIGERVYSMSAIEPPPDMHEKLMRTLAAEHEHYLRHPSSSRPATPPPAFLKSYLKDDSLHRRMPDALHTFSTAETGPLPNIRAKTHKRRTPPMGHFAVIGLVASLLIVLMMGGLTSLLLLAHGNPEKALNNSSNSVVVPSSVIRASYTTSTEYRHVASAVADRNSIYYTAYDDASSANWMLEQMDRAKQMSTPLLDAPVNSPLMVLGSSDDWLAWLQLGLPSTPKHQTNVHQADNYLVRTWSMHLLSLTTGQQVTTAGSGNALLSGTFDSSVVPSWVHTPIQGTWFTPNSLFVAMIDNNGLSHLWQYQLDTYPMARVEIATASTNHTLTSPTATSDDTHIYWSEEWLDEVGTLHSTIWTQSAVDVLIRAHGVRDSQTVTRKYLFRADETSFQPQVVNDTLFFISTADLQIPGSTTPGTKPTATAASTSPTSSSIIARVADTFSTPQIDATVRGTLFEVVPDSNAGMPYTQITTNGPVSALQGGASFLLWQTEQGYGMLNVATDTTYVNVAAATDGAHFLAVNGDTAVWTVNTDTPPAETPAAGLTTTLLAFNWPK